MGRRPVPHCADSARRRLRGSLLQGSGPLAHRIERGAVDLRFEDLGADEPLVKAVERFQRFLGRGSQLCGSLVR